MYLFTRSRRVDPEHFTKSMESVVDLTEHGRKVTGRRVDAWTAVMSPEVGTIVWTLWAEKIGQILLMGCGTWMLLGVLVMRKMIAFDY